MQPLPLDTILSEFNEDTTMWVLQSKNIGNYLVVPDNRFPGRKPIRFFMSSLDANRFLSAVLEESPKLKSNNIIPIEVKLFTALHNIASDKTPNNADSFVIHSPNEVFEFLNNRNK